MLAILTTHPIQYQTPLWQALAADGQVPFEVWYLTAHGVEPSLDVEFGRRFSWDVDVLSGYPHRFLETPAGASPVTALRCRLTERLRRRLRTSGAKALWIQGWQVAAYWQAVREAKAAGAEVWLRGESNDLAPSRAGKRLLKTAALGWLFRHVDRFLYIGSANKRLYERYGVVDARLYRAAYCVDNERFARQAAALQGERMHLRRAWGIADDAFCALFCGKFVAKKRPLDLVAAAGRLTASGRMRNIHLLFAGSGELDKPLRAGCVIAFDAVGGGRPATKSGTDDGKPLASFTGFLNQSEISRAYVAADCLVLPSDHRETWGLVVNEARASGLPCVVSDACGCAEDLAGAGAVFPLGDSPALAERLSHLAADPGDRSSPPLPTIAETVHTVADVYRRTAASG